MAKYVQNPLYRKSNNPRLWWLFAGLMALAGPAIYWLIEAELQGNGQVRVHWVIKLIVEWFGTVGVVVFSEALAVILAIHAFRTQRKFG